MNFISWAFVALLAVVLLFRGTVGRRRHTAWPVVAVVTLASTVFVMWHVPVYILIMLTSIGADYVAANRIDRAPRDSRRRTLWLVGSLAVNLGLLGFFKYINFAIENVQAMLGTLGIAASLPTLKFVLPMGISFYTFCSMSYTIDVYRRRIRPVRLVDFYYFVTFFPHLVAGPIIRAEEFFYQMSRTRRLRLRVVTQGVFLIICGLFLKMVCADNIGGVVDDHWKKASLGRFGSAGPALLTVLFAAQIFCDFAAYTSIARGVAYLLGFRFPINFNSPYIAGSFRNFWERWHITLSRWLRDYLYIPLGGNRVPPVRIYANLLIVMLLGGLWHGAAGTFLVWGAIHGVALAVERLIGLHRAAEGRGGMVLRAAWFVIVQVTVLIAWVFFRSASAGDAMAFLGNMVWPKARATGDLRLILLACLFLLPVVAMHLHQWLVERRVLRPLAPVGKAILAAVLLYATCALYGVSSDFIYFQF